MPLTLYAQQELPEGYRWGDHWGEPGSGVDGYWVIYTDGSAVKVRTVPDPRFRLDPAEFEAAYREAMNEMEASR